MSELSKFILFVKTLPICVNQNCKRDDKNLSGALGIRHMSSALILNFDNFEVIFEIISHILFTKFKNRV